MKFFVWLSGADRDILAQCTNLRRSERIRFAGLGALILIPPVLGFVSMAYAVSTIVPNMAVAAGGGLVWALIILSVDRYLVSTLYKSKLRGGGTRALAMLARFAFAVIVGVAVSHPLVLLWFEDSITQQLAVQQRAAVDARLKQGEQAKARVPQSTSAALIKSKSATVDCLRRLQTYEQSNQQRDLPCGVSSGIATCMSRCVTIIRQIEATEAEIARLRTADRTAQSRRDDQISAVDAATRRDVADIRRHFSDDYLARVAALEQIAERSSQVDHVQWFLILLFVFVDILPLTMKIATPMGEYEEIRDSRLTEAQVEQRIARDLAQSGVAYQAVAEARAQNASLRAELGDLAKLTFEFIENYDKGRAAFSRRKIRAAKSTAEDGVDRAEQESQINNVFNEAWQRALARFRTHLERT